MSKIRIVDVRDNPNLTIERAGKMDVQVTYNVDEQRQYTITMPKEEFTPEKAMAKIRADEQERLKLIGETFDVQKG